MVLALLLRQRSKSGRLAGFKERSFGWLPLDCQPLASLWANLFIKLYKRLKYKYTLNKCIIEK